MLRSRAPRPQTVVSIIAMLATALAFGQDGTPPPSFEVTSVKVNTTGHPSGMFPTPGTLTVGNRTLKGLISEVYNLRNYQIAGADGWMNSIPYDIVGKAKGPANFQQMLAMMKTLMAGRFQLQFHRETKELPTYWLVVAKNGPKLQRADPSDPKPGGISNRGHFIQGWKQPVERLAAFLGAEIQMPVIDKSGLQDRYDFKLEWAEDARPSTPGDLPDLEKPSLLAAVQEQLGLKLEVHPGPVQILVVDHAAKPSEN